MKNTETINIIYRYNKDVDNNDIIINNSKKN